MYVEAVFMMTGLSKYRVDHICSFQTFVTENPKITYTVIEEEEQYRIELMAKISCLLCGIDLKRVMPYLKITIFISPVRI